LIRAPWTVPRLRNFGIKERAVHRFNRASFIE
jgi:hypothetical protein